LGSGRETIRGTVSRERILVVDDDAGCDRRPTDAGRRGARRRRTLVWTPDPGVVEIVRVLLLMQAGFALLSTVGALAVGLFTGTLAPLQPTLAVSAGAAVAALILSARLGRRSWRARRLVMVGECLVLAGALVDLTLSLAIVHEPLGLVPVLTRIVVPVAVLVLLRRQRARTPATSSPLAAITAP
jgi:hypothetical protein